MLSTFSLFPSFCCDIHPVAIFFPTFDSFLYFSFFISLFYGHISSVLFLMPFLNSEFILLPKKLCNHKLTFRNFLFFSKKLCNQKLTFRNFVFFCSNGLIQRRGRRHRNQSNNKTNRHLPRLGIRKTPHNRPDRDPLDHSPPLSLPKNFEIGENLLHQSRLHRLHPLLDPHPNRNDERDCVSCTIASSPCTRENISGPTTPTLGHFSTRTSSRQLESWLSVSTSFAKIPKDIFLAFMCHHNTFLIYGSMENATEKRWEIVTHISILTSLVVALLFGIAGYATFTAFSQGESPNIP
jgi:hypothetical protein